MTTEWTIKSMQELLDQSPFIRYAGICVLEIDQAAKKLALKMPCRDEFLRGDEGNMWHGGPVAALVDTAGDFAIALEAGGGVPTVNFRTDYLRPCLGDHLVATAIVRKVGRTLGVADINIYDDQDRLCVIGRGTYSTVIA